MFNSITIELFLLNKFSSRAFQVSIYVAATEFQFYSHLYMHRAKYTSILVVQRPKIRAQESELKIVKR